MGESGVWLNVICHQVPALSLLLQQDAYQEADKITDDAWRDLCFHNLPTRTMEWQIVQLLFSSSSSLPARLLEAGEQRISKV